MDSVLVFVGEGCKSVVREASEAVWNRRGFASEEGFAQVREVAEDCSNPEEEENS